MLLVTNPRVLGDPGQPEDEAVLLLRGDGGQLGLVTAGARQAGRGPGHLRHNILREMYKKVKYLVSKKFVTACS